MKKNHVIFDCETSPLPESELLHLIPPFDPSEVKCGNIKDPVKIAEKIAQAEADHKTNFIERAALSAISGKVLAIGVKRGDSISVSHGNDEKDILMDFWNYYDLWQLDSFVGFNIFNFDLPFLIRRSWKLGVKIPTGVREGRYWSRFFIDLKDVWTFNNKTEYISLDSLCKHLGLGGKTGNGADFAKLYVTDQAAALAYLKNDLELTAKVAEILL